MLCCGSGSEFFSGVGILLWPCIKAVKKGKIFFFNDFFRKFIRRFFKQEKMYGPRIRTQVSKGSSGSGRNWYTDPSLLLRRFKTYKQAKKSHRDFPFLFYYFLMTIFCTTQWSAESRFGSGKIIWFRTDFPRHFTNVGIFSGTYRENFTKVGIFRDR